MTCGDETRPVAGACDQLRRRSGAWLPTLPLLRCPQPAEVNNDNAKRRQPASVNGGHPNALRLLPTLRQTPARRNQVRPLPRDAAAGPRREAGWSVMSPGFAIVALAGLGLGVWVLHKIGRALASILEALAAAAVVFVALWWLCKAVVWMLAQVVTRWRTSLAVVAVYAWCELFGWLSLALIFGGVAAVLLAWWAIDAVSFDQWCWRFLRSWWARWAVYGRKLPEWLHACGLSVRDEALPVVVNVNLVGRRRALSRSTSNRPNARLPKVLGVRSGASWDEVRVELVPGQKPEDFDDAARALAVARKVARCQVRELAPNVVSIDFQRRDLLGGGVAGPQVPDGVDSTGVDLRNVWAGRTEYGRDWRVPLLGSGAHCLTAGASGAGKNSVMWCPLVAAASAIRAGVVRMSGIDPKGMELAYGRGIFARYAVSGEDAIEV